MCQMKMVIYHDISSKMFGEAQALSSPVCHDSSEHTRLSHRGWN